MSSAGELPRAGDEIDRYEVLSRVAFGGMAAVYAVRRRSIGGFDKVLAMKVMLPHLADNRDSVDMFLDEGRIAARIEHPNVLQVFDVAEHGQTPFMIMEYVRGQSLAAVAKAHEEPLPLGFVISVLARCAEGLHAAHETTDMAGEPLGVVHRDVSPHNVMVSYDGDVKVVDFGIAAARGRLASTRTGELKGKLGYVAPEAVSKSRPVDRRADVWGLGVMAWELLSGRRLFRDDDDATTLWNVMHGEVERLSKLRDDLPAALVRCVHKALERDVDARHATCGAMAEELTAIAQQLERSGRADRSTFMRSLFAEEDAAARERLKSMIDGLPAVGKDDAPLAAVEGTDVTAETVVAEPASPWRSRALGLAAVAVGGVVAVSWFGATGGEPSVEVAEPGATAPATTSSVDEVAPEAVPAPSATASATATSTASAVVAPPTPSTVGAPPKPRPAPPPAPASTSPFINPYKKKP